MRDTIPSRIEKWHTEPQNGALSTPYHRLSLLYRIFRCITRCFLLLRRPGAGYIINVGYTLLKSKFSYNYILISFAEYCV